jgi:hypothetical protein
MDRCPSTVRSPPQHHHAPPAPARSPVHPRILRPCAIRVDKLGNAAVFSTSFNRLVPQFRRKLLMWYLFRLSRPRMCLAAAVLVAGLFVASPSSAHAADAASNPFVPVAHTQPAAPVATVSQCPPGYRTIPTDPGSSVPFICQAPGRTQPVPGGTPKCSLRAGGVLMCPGPNGKWFTIPAPGAPVPPGKRGCPYDMTTAQCQLDPRYR